MDSLLVHDLQCFAFLGLGLHRAVRSVVLPGEDAWSYLSEALHAKAQTQTVNLSLLRLSCRSNSDLLPASGFPLYFARRCARFAHPFQFDTFGWLHKEPLRQILLLLMYYNLCYFIDLFYWSTRAPSCYHSRRPHPDLWRVLASISYCQFLFLHCIAFWVHFETALLHLMKNSLLADHDSSTFFDWWGSYPDGSHCLHFQLAFPF